MFKITCFVEDSKLGAVKRALAGTGAKEVTDQPVVNVEQTANGKLQAKTEGGLTDRVWAVLLAVKPRLKSVSNSDLKAIIVAQGGSATSVYHVTSTMLREGRLKRAGKGAFTLNRRA